MKQITIIFSLFSCYNIANAQRFYQTSQNGKIGLLNYSGNILAPNLYDYFGEFNEGLMPAKINGKYGYLNALGKMVIKSTFEYADEFKGNFAIVSRGDKYGLINKT